MNKSHLLSALATLVLAAVLAGCGLFPGGQAGQALTASGTIETDTVHLAPEVSGKIVALVAGQGEPVEAGQVLFRLDDAALQAQRKQAAAALQAAQAAHRSAQANLDLLQAGATPEQLDAAQAQLDGAEANRQAIQANLWAVTADTRPEDVRAAQARLDLARQAYDSLTVTLTNTQLEAVQDVVNRATSNLDDARTRRENLSASSRMPAGARDAAAAAVQDAQAALACAQAGFDVVQDGSMPFSRQIEAVQSCAGTAGLLLTQAEARQAALRAEADMPTEALEAAQAAVDDARDLQDEAQAAYDSLTGGDQAGRLASAWDEMSAAQRDLNALGRTQSGGSTLEALLSQLQAATAQRDAARANLAALQNGSRPEQIAAAQGQLDAAAAQAAAAQAALDLIDVQLSKLSVSAPISGVVLARGLNLGEMAAPGASVMELGALDPVQLTVYIPEDQYGQISLGQEAAIQVDSYPGVTFTGTVTHIADQAEFTPRNVQTVESRSATVYAVEISIPNPENQLKPGMPADATF
jgi:HlyD family secretion protein